MVAKKTDRSFLPASLREPLGVAQERLVAAESEIEKLLAELLRKGEERARELTAFVQRLAKQGFGLDEVRDLLAKLPSQGSERASELREWAGGVRSEALKQFEHLQDRAYAFFGMASRRQVEELGRELSRLSRRLEKGGKATAPHKNAVRSVS
jgi:DNA-binding transcriptional MerR regulator